MSSLGVIGLGIFIGLGGGSWHDVILNIEPAAFQYWYFVPVAVAGLVFAALRLLGARRGWTVHQLPGETSTQEPAAG